MIYNATEIWSTYSCDLHFLGYYVSSTSIQVHPMRARPNLTGLLILWSYLRKCHAFHASLFEQNSRGNRRYCPCCAEDFICYNALMQFRMLFGVITSPLDTYRSSWIGSAASADNSETCADRTAISGSFDSSWAWRPLETKKTVLPSSVQVLFTPIERNESQCHFVCQQLK